MQIWHFELHFEIYKIPPLSKSIRDFIADQRPGARCKSSSILLLFFSRVLVYTENAIQKQKEKNTIRKDTAMYFNEQMFNPNTVNQQYYDSVKAQIEQYNRSQDKEILNAVKAIHDLCDAVKKLDSAHQQAAFYACLQQMAIEMNWQ